jgi:2-phosphoglycerate kinase
MGATNVGDTCLSSEVTRRVLTVEEELATPHYSEVTRRVVLMEEELPTLQK